VSSPQHLFDLRHKLLNQHHEHYVSFTRLILTLATASFSLLAAFRDTLLSGAGYSGFITAAFPALLVSILAGVFVQHRIMMNPLWHLDEAHRLSNEQEKQGASDPVELRRKPTAAESVFYRVQLFSFVLAFVLLAAFLYVHKAP